MKKICCDHTPIPLYAPKAPRQVNTHDCGLFTARFASAFSKYANIEFKREHVLNRHGSHTRLFRQLFSDNAFRDFNQVSVDAMRRNTAMLCRRLCESYIKMKIKDAPKTQKKGKTKKHSVG